MDYSKHLVSNSVKRPIPGKEKMVENNTGGFVFSVSPEQRVRRFLIMGTEGGTYYASEKKLTIENAGTIQKLAQQGAPWLVPLITEVSVEALAPKNDPAIFALALAATFGTPEVKKQAYEAIPKVCRIGTHIYTFCQNIKGLRHWSRGLRSGVGAYYENKTLEQFAYDTLKYRQRNGWTPLDVIRLSHPSLPITHKGMIEDMKGKEHTLEVPTIWAAFQQLQKTTDAKAAIDLIQKNRLPWEAVPTELHGKAEIWEALLPEMGMTAVLRNLSRFAKLGVTSETGMDDNSRRIIAKLTDATQVQKSRIHPITILNGWRAFAGARVSRSRWTRAVEGYTPSTKIQEALDKSFYLAFKNVEPTNVPQMLALDVSGSMSGADIAGTFLTAREASAALACVTLAIEPEVIITGFSDNIIPLDIRKGMPLDKVIDYVEGLDFSSTNASLAIQYALRKGLKLGAFSIYTDNEVNAGAHPEVALREYRKKTGIDAKMVVVGMTATDFTIADPSDAGMLDIAGFSSDTPAAISAFIRGGV